MKKQVSFRMNEDEYKKLRVLLLKEGKTFQEYMLELIEKDLKNRGEE